MKCHEVFHLMCTRMDIILLCSGPYSKSSNVKFLSHLDEVQWYYHWFYYVLLISMINTLGSKSCILRESERTSFWSCTLKKHLL